MIHYKTRPAPSNTLPTGIPYIVGNEAAERLSYYGMRAILVIFMTQYLMNSSGQPDVMSENEAQGYFHLFVSTVYFMPLLGALLADGLLGKYRTIIFLSLIYCLGHFALALDDTRMGLLIGQGLIAMGAGGIKPCVSAHIGDQFGIANRHLMTKVFSWFYFSINFGAFTAIFLCYLSVFKPVFCFNGIKKNDRRFIPDGYCFYHTRHYTNATGQWFNPSYHLAVSCLFIFNICRSYGFHYLS